MSMTLLAYALVGVAALLLIGGGVYFYRLRNQPQNRLK